MTTFLHDTPFAGHEPAFREAVLAVWSAIQDDVTSAVDPDNEDNDHVETEYAAECVLDLGCFDQYCRLTPIQLEAWKALNREDDLRHRRDKLIIDALHGWT